MTTTFASHFRTETRVEGATYLTLAATAPEWLQAAVREAHQGSLPSDWIYTECKAAVEAFDEGSLDDSEDDNSVHAHADGRVDIYTQGLYQWAADFCRTGTWAAAEQEAEDMGMPAETDRRIAAVQYAAIRHIADTMREACRKAVGERVAAAP